MMSAPTASTETPVTAPLAGTPGAKPGAAPAGLTGFQSLLAAALPTQSPGLIQTLPAQTPAPLTAPAPVTTAAGTTPDVSPADMLRMLAEGGMLAESGESAPESPEELADTEDSANDEELVREWLDMMLPFSVQAPQAGAGRDGAQGGESGDGSGADGGDPADGELPISLVRQAGLPARNETPDAAAAAPGVSTARDPAAASALAALQAITPSRESAAVEERDSAASENRMTALGELGGKRASESAPIQSRLATPVQDPRWAEALAHRLVMLAREGESVAQLKLVPVDLGPLDIQITVRDGEASVHFGAAHAETRAALEASMPRLREMLSAQGLQLSNASVSQHSFGKSSPERGGVAAVGAVAEEAEVAAAKSVSTSLLDTYA